jgi:hypothetical protein
MDRHAALPASGMPPRPSGRSVEQSIAINASPEMVWAVLADVDAWGGWNPIYPQASGSLIPGATIALTIVLPGMKPQKSTATVFHAFPGRAVQFGASAFLGLLHATRYIEIYASPSGGCTVVNGETFSRLLGRPLVRMVGEKISNGLQRQNDGLKAATESRCDS